MSGRLSTPLGAGLLAAVVGVACFLLVPPGGDAAAHEYLAWAFHERGVAFWDNLWYSGRYSQVNYSLLYPPLASALGPLALAALSCAGAAAAFADVVRRTWPDLAAPPVIAFAVLVPAGGVQATVFPFLLGLALALAGLAALLRRRVALAVACGAATAATHLLAFGYLVMTLGALAVVARGWWRQRALVVGAVCLGAVLLAQVLALRAFALPGDRYPFAPWDAVAIGLFCTAGIALSARVPRMAPVTAVFAAYALASTLALSVPGPVGGNVVRLLVLAGAPLLLIPIAARGWTPRPVVAAVLVATLAWQGSGVVYRASTAAGARSADEGYWRPVEAFLAERGQPDHRVHVVSTALHWEADRLPRLGVPLARGWYRQNDFPPNEPLYAPLTAGAYERWLRDVGVRYVLLPDDPLDYTSGAEADLLRSGRSGLRRVARLGAHWVAYELPDPTPIVTPAEGARVVALTPDEVRLRVTRPGDYALRVRYTPYWSVSPTTACVEADGRWATRLRVREPGEVTLRFAPSPRTVALRLVGGGAGC